MDLKNKKSAAHPEATPHNQRHINVTPPGNKNQWLAEFLIEHIGDREHPLKRPKSPSVDRILRGLISERNAKGEDIIINNGEGYFRPGPDDRSAVFEYWAKETHRAREIKNKADMMMTIFTEMYGGYE